MMISALAVLALAAAPQVKVSSGVLQGAWEVGTSIAVAAFRDVPYATAGRFEAPKPAANWTGMRDATNFGPGCMQPNSSTRHPNPDVPTFKSEDCLHLNVFAPWSRTARPATTGSLMPVMVWWHGGAYQEGSSFGPFNLYDGGRVAAAGEVVIVSCNYRLGALGALVHDGGLDGNYGFLDQRACLQWVQDNAHAFGGNRSMVTLWGQSAGAQSIWLHMASAGSAGLFHRAIQESAVDLSLFDRKQAAKLGKETAKKLGCRKQTDAETIACMRTADLDDLFRASKEAEGSFLTIVESLNLKHPTGTFLPFKPNIDGVNFVEQPMQTILEQRAPAAVPTLLGFNHDEMWALLSSLPSWLRGLEVDVALSILFGVETGLKAWSHYKHLASGHDKTAAVVKILTDYLFTCAGQASALALPHPSYVYQYNHADSFGREIFSRFGLPQCAIDGRVCHMAEIPLVFNNTGPADLNATLSRAELGLSAQIMRAFTTFAKGGSPGWQPFEAGQRMGLVINQTFAAGSLGEASKVCVDIWDHTGYLH